MAYTNKGLVEYAKKCLALGENSVYVYGTFGNKLTTSLATSKYKQYPKINTSSRTTKYKKLCDGKHYAFDCVGLIKSYYWGGYGKTTYKSSQDVSANGMYTKAKVKGNISTIDKNKVGLLVQMNGHIGIYIGNGEVIESTISTKYAKQSHGLGGVCKTKLSDRKWLHWLECPFITYEKETKTTTTTSKAKGTITINSGTWNVRKGAGTSYAIVKVVKGGTKLNYYSTSNGWYKVDDGYISSKAVKTTGVTKTTTSSGTTKTTTGNVYLRKTASYGNNIVCTIPKGAKVTYYSGTGWAKVKYNGKTGYCGYKYLK